MELTVSTKKGFELRTYYILASTGVGNSFRQKFYLEACGLEVVSTVANATANITLYDYAWNTGFKKAVDVRDWFESNKANCPITSYEIYHDKNVTQKYAGTQIGVDQATGDLIVYTTHNILSEFWVKAYTHAGNYAV